MKRAFTLLELIIVIVILGILATLGYNQYTKMMEKMRISEAVANLGKMRKNAINYYLENGTLSGIANANLGVGSAADELPVSCNGSTYFRYWFDSNTGTWMQLNATRCESGGKTPNFAGGYSYRILIELSTPSFNVVWRCYNDSAGQYLDWCTP